MTIRTRLALGVFAIAAVLLVPLFLSLRSLGRVDDDVTQLRNEEIERLVLLRRASGALDDFERAAEVAALPSSLRPRAALDDERRRAGAFDPVQLVAMADLLEADTFDSAAFHYRDAARLYERGSDPGPAIALARRWINSDERNVAASATRVVESAARETNRSSDVAAWALVIAVALAIGIGTWLTVSIGRPVAALKEGMLSVAEGDFSHPLRIAPGRSDEFGVLAESFATMTGRLSQLERMKAVWTGIVTHELKTPINVIMGYLQLGEDGILGELTPEQRTAFTTMARNANVLKRRVQRLLDVSQFEAGAGKLTRSHVDLGHLLDGVEASFAVIGQDRKVGFRAERASGLPAVVHWDQDRVAEVLDNLLSNAFKFTAAGGMVELRTEPADAAVRFEVRDSGAGIPVDQIPKLFRRFYQADNQDQASAKGTGLGLAIAKEIVEAHGGTIQCDSTVGVGTTFTVIMPAAATSPPISPRTHAGGASVTSSPSRGSSTAVQDSAPRP